MTARRWTRADFQTRASNRQIDRHGFTRGAFGVAKDGREWLIFHLPTGMMFLYSEWPTAREARSFADALLEKGDWNDKRLDQHPKAFTGAGHAIAAARGIELRKMRAIC